MTKDALAYVNEHRDRFMDELRELLTIPSISTMVEHTGDVQHAAEWLSAHLKTIGLNRVQVMETEGHPVVYAEWLEADGAPTVLAYGHYDVQPVDPLEEWISPPFEPTERDGFLYARGASDDKGQMMAQLKAIEAMLKAEGGLPVNVKVMLEGAEESGSRGLFSYIEEYKDLLAADSIAVCDGSMLAADQPSITTGLRGLVSARIDVRGPAHDLHSGSYGGTIHNPAQAIAEVVAALHNPDGSVAVPGFYDSVRELTDDLRADLAKKGYTEADWKRETGASRTWGEADFSLTERITVRPTLEVNGIFGGWSGEGTKTVIPSSAGANITCRLVPDQDPKAVAAAIKRYVNQLAPDTVELTVTVRDRSGAVVVDHDAPQMQAAVRAYEKVYGASPIFHREGGSIPAVAMFKEILNSPAVLLNIGLPDDGYHRPNERFSIDLYYKGIELIIHYFHALAQQG